MCAQMLKKKLIFLDCDSKTGYKWFLILVDWNFGLFHTLNGHKKKNSYFKKNI